MSTVKISALPPLPAINANTSNTLFLGVDLPTSITGKFTATTLAQQLYANNYLVVGQNYQTIFSNTVGQFSGTDPVFLQINMQNFSSTGSADFVATTNDGTNANSYIDMGINGSAYADNTFSATAAHDGYLYVHGPSDTSYTGNLVVGTFSTGSVLKFMVGGSNTANIPAIVSNTGLVFTNGGKIIFNDGTTQSTGAAPNNYTIGAYTTANAAFLQANAANNLATSGYAQANSANNMAIGAYNLSNTAVQNTNTIIVNNLQIASRLIANSIGGSVSFNNVISTLVNFSNSISVPNLISTSISSANSIQWVQQLQKPTQNTGQVWYYANTINLILDTDISNDRPALGKVIYERVYNSTGTTINASSWVKLAGQVTSNSVAYISLADCTNAANSIALGFVKNAISNGAYGFVYTSGIVDDVNLSSFTSGDLIFLSTTPGAATNVAPYGQSLSTIALGKVLSNSSTIGKLQIAIQPQQAYGKANGSVMYANNNLIVASNTLVINESANTLTMNGIIVIQSSNFPGNVSAIRIDGSNNAAGQATTASGTMLQIVGKDGGYATRMILDNYNAANTTAYNLIAGRGARGNAANPTVTQSNDIFLRVGGSGYGTSGYGLTGGAVIDYVATETWSDTNKGTSLIFGATPTGSNVRTANVMSITGNSVILNSNTRLIMLGKPSSNGVLYVDGSNTVLASSNVIVDETNSRLQVSNTGATGNAAFAVSYINYTPTYPNGQSGDKKGMMFLDVNNLIGNGLRMYWCNADYTTGGVKIWYYGTTTFGVWA